MAKQGTYRVSLSNLAEETLIRKTYWGTSEKAATAAAEEMVGGRRRDEDSWRRIFEMPDSLLNEAEAEPEALLIFWLFEKLLLCERENMVKVLLEGDEII